MGIGYRIKEAREKLGLTQTELGKKLGVTGSAVTNYENNVSHPKEPILYKLLEVLNVDANYLFQDEMNGAKSNNILTIAEKEHIKKYRALDEHGKKISDLILDEEYNRCTYIREKKKTVVELDFSYLPASAGDGEFLSEEFTEKREYPDTPISRRADIVIPVSGRSMEPMYCDGDEMYVRLQPAVEIGEIGIFMIDGTGYVKEYAEDRLISINPDYDDIFPAEFNEVKCVGKVLGKVAP